MSYYIPGSMLGGIMGLKIEINNQQPVELTELTLSLMAFSREFSRHALNNGFPEEHRETKLYIDRIVTGSIIAELFEGVANFGQSVMPMLDDTNNIVGFVTFLKSTLAWFTQKKGEKPNLKESELQDLAAILMPVANDPGAQITFEARDNATVYVTVNLSADEAQIARTSIEHEIANLKVLENYGLLEKVLFYWKRTSKNSKAKDANRGVIEAISRGAVNVFIDDEIIRQQMIDPNENPFHMLFVVDAQVERIQDKVALYRITKLHQAYLQDIPPSEE